MKQFSLASSYVPDQGTIDPISSLYNTPHNGPYTLTLDPLIASDHFTTTIVDIYRTRYWLLNISPFGAKYSICIDSC